LHEILSKLLQKYTPPALLPLVGIVTPCCSGVTKKQFLFRLKR
jgi:hypothetical protein